MTVDFETTCVCGHDEDDHGHIDALPGSTECNVDDCGCVAYEWDGNGGGQ